MILLVGISGEGTIGSSANGHNPGDAKMTTTIEKVPQVKTVKGWGNVSDPTPVYTAVGDDCEAVVMAVDGGGYRVRFNDGMTFRGDYAELADAQAFADAIVA